MEKQFRQQISKKPPAAFTGIEYKLKYSPRHIAETVEEALTKWAIFLASLESVMNDSPDQVLLFSSKFPKVDPATFYAIFILGHKNEEYGKLYLKYNLQNYKISIIDEVYYFGTEKALEAKRNNILNNKKKGRDEGREQKFQELRDNLLKSMKTGDIVLNRDLKLRIGLGCDPATPFLKRLVLEGFLEVVSETRPIQYRKTNKQN